jgi:hypothetical protein
MILPFNVAILATLLLPAVVQAKTETPALHRVLKSRNDGADNYFALIISADQAYFPACMSSVLGSGNVIATVRDNLFCIKLSHNSLSGPVLFSHLHGPAAVGESGPVIFTMDTNSEKTQCFILTEDQKKDLDDELWYFDIHSDFCRSDAIRGQILPLVSNVGSIIQHLRQRPVVDVVTEALIK